MGNIKFKDKELVLLCAFRYALGRRTYIVSMIVKEIINNWNNIIPELQSKLKYEIINYKETYTNLGMECDEVQWNKILEL